MLARTEPGGFYRVEPLFKAALGRAVAAVLRTHVFMIDHALARVAAYQRSVGGIGAAVLPVADAEAAGDVGVPVPRHPGLAA